MLGCALPVGIVGFVIGLTCAWFSTDPTKLHPLVSAGMVGGMSFVAALILCMRDRNRHDYAMRDVREMLEDRTNIRADEFAAAFPDVDPVLLDQVRCAVAQYLNVPADKIHPTDDLQTELQFDTFGPAAHFFVAYHVFNARQVAPHAVPLSVGSRCDIGDLTREIQRVLDGFVDRDQAPSGGTY